MLASTASTPAQGGAIIRFSGTKEAKNEVEVSYIVFASRRFCVSEKKRDREREREKRRESVPPMMTKAVERSFFLSREEVAE